MTDWDAIVAEHASAVWRTAYRLVNNEADADDCLQEAFVSAIRLTQHQTVGDWRRLLRRMATVRALDRLRRRARESARIERAVDGDLPAGEESCPQLQAQCLELSQRLRQMLARLPCRESEVFCLHHLSGMTSGEIAEELGISANCVRVTLHRARLRLRELLAAASGSVR